MDLRPRLLLIREISLKTEYSTTSNSSYETCFVRRVTVSSPLKGKENDNDNRTFLGKRLNRTLRVLGRYRDCTG